MGIKHGGIDLDEIVVVSGKRTPFGKFGGALRDRSSVELGGLVIRKVMENSVKASWMEAGKKRRWLSALQDARSGGVV